MHRYIITIFIGGLLLLSSWLETPFMVRGVDTDVITLEFSFSKPKLILENNDTYKIIIDDLPVTNDIGKPRLPVRPTRILLPMNKKIGSISVSYKERQLLATGLKVETGSILTTLKEELDGIGKKEFIKFDSVNNLYSIIGVYKWRGYPILVLNLYPVTYDHNNGSIYYYPDLTLKVITEDSPGGIAIRGLKRDEEIIMSMVDNPWYISTYNNIKTRCKDSLKYIVITNESFANSGLEDNFQYLIESKIARGVNAAIFTVEDIMSNPDYGVNGTWGDNNPDNPFYEHSIKNYNMFDDKAARIRNFIRYAYMELGVDYVLLGGDADTKNEKENIIPVRGLFANESGLPLNGVLDEEEADIPSDIYYACLDGTFNYDEDNHFGESPDRNNITYLDEADLYSEVWVGRACIDSDVEEANFVMKTLRYENSKDPYLKKVLMVGEHLGFPGISEYGGNYKDLIKPLIPSDYYVDTLYDRDATWSKYDIIEIINNATPHIINHDGHSYYRYNLKMSIEDVDLLTNENLFFLYSHGCMAGGFDNPLGYDCIAERYTVETPFGAFAAIMNSRYGLGSSDSLDSPSLFLDKSFFKALFSENIRELGRANHYSKEDNVWRINENGVRWIYYETNLFGDPEVRIKNPIPIEINLSIDIVHPDNGLYIFNRKIISIPFLESPIIFGGFTVEINASSQPEGYLYYVELSLDDESIGTLNNPPYEWEINTRVIGSHTIKGVAHGYFGEQDNDTLAFYGFIL